MQGLQNVFSGFFDQLAENMNGEITFWTVFGTTGVLVFGARFYVQWLASEKAKKTVIPDSFWYLSILGSLMMLVYSIREGKAPFILSYLFPTLIYIRNLMLTHKDRKRTEAAALAAVPVEGTTAKTIESEAPRAKVA